MLFYVFNQKYKRLNINSKNQNPLILALKMVSSSDFTVLEVYDLRFILLQLNIASQLQNYNL